MSLVCYEKEGHSPMKQRSVFSLLLLALLVFAYCPHAGASSNLFLPYTAIPTGSRPEAVAIGDVNGDGRNDVVMTTSYYFDPTNDYHLHVFLQDASGKLEPVVKYPTSGTYSNRPGSISIGDVNNDGRADIVVGNSQDSIEVFLQNANGGLEPGRRYPTVNSTSVKIGDLNNDGLLDVAAIGWGSGTVDIFFQNRGETFNPPVTFSVTHNGYDEIEIGDVNNDGLNDIIVMSGQGLVPNIGVLLQQSGGTFSPPAYYSVGSSERTSGVALGDVNGDSLNDIVVSYGGNKPASHIGIFHQNATNTLDPAESLESYDIPEPVAVADMNGDGRQDIVTLHGGWNAMGVYLQQADGSLLPEQLMSIPYASHYNPQGLDLGDINGDGAADVVISDYNSGLVILYGKGKAPIISLSPGSITFPATTVGQSSASIIIVTNTGDAGLTIGTIGISGTVSESFSFKVDSCSGQTIAPTASCSISVAFTPSTEGNKFATLTIPSNDQENSSATVSFSGLALPRSYTITAKAGIGGSILPGTTTVTEGRSITFTIQPNTEYHILDVKIDGASKGHITSYTFSNVSSDHIIEAVFRVPDGDADRDGRVTSRDAKLAYKFANGQLTPTPVDLAYCDVAPIVNGKPAPDGRIDLFDVEVIQLKARGKINW